MYSNLVWLIGIFIVLVALYKPISFILYSLAALISKAKKINGPGFNIDLGSKSESDANQKYLDMSKAFQSLVITEEEKIISKQLNEASLNKDQAINVLITHLANKNVIVSMIFIDKLILNEQISLLYDLNAKNQPCAAVDLEHHYKKFKENANPDYPITYENFFGFLTQNNLISLNYNDYKITPFGKEYLTFIIKVGRKLN